MWIIRENNEQYGYLPTFYKRFSVGKALQSCVLHISALGIFHVKINGQAIDDYFMPGWTNYNRYIHLCHYDLIPYLQAENLLEVTLAEGWFSGRLGYTRKSKVYGEQNAIFAELTLSYADGEVEMLPADETWRVGDSNIVKASLFDGETVDFTKKKEAVDGLPCAKPYDFTADFVDYDYEPTRRVEELTPDILFAEDGVIRLDFKQNFAGFLNFYAEGERGATVTVKHAEMLNKDGALYYENLRTVEATDRVICSGGKDKFDPKFTFHGFRYAEITLDGDVKLTDIKGIALSQEMDYHGKFLCSDEIMNRVYQNALWGQKGNFISIPTDCPQRDERLGWTGDAQVFCNSAMFNADCNRFFANYLRLIRTDMQADGKVPSLVPFFIPVSVSTAGVPGWADAICVIPYTHYLHYRDKRVLEENLPTAVKHLEYYLSKCENGLIKIDNPFGDWLSVVRADDIDGISQCFLGLSARLISKMYALLGDESNAVKYGGIYEQAKTAFRQHYLGENGKIAGDSQTIYAFSLSVGYVTAEEIKAPFLDSIHRAGDKLTTGFIGVKYLLPALCDVGEMDLAYKIAKETEYPSWGYTILQGATTIWERWNGYTEEHGFETPGMNSFNHYSLGSCVEWFYGYVLGIKLSENGKITVRPSLSKELSFAKGEYRSIQGKIGVEWQYEGGRYEVKVFADADVDYVCDFTGMEIISMETNNGVTIAVVK